MDLTQASIFDRSQSTKDQGLNPLNQVLSAIRRLGKDLSGIRHAHQALTNCIHQIEDWRRRPFPPSVLNTYFEVANQFFNGLCPCCGESTILIPTGGRLPSLEIDHFRGCRWNKINDAGNFTDAAGNLKDVYERLAAIHDIVSNDRDGARARFAKEMIVQSALEAVSGELKTELARILPGIDAIRRQTNSPEE